MVKRLEQIFENALWQTRLVVIAAVIASLFAAFTMFYLATVDAFYMVSHLPDYASRALDGGIALIGLSLYLSRAGEPGGKH